MIAGTRGTATRRRAAAAAAPRGATCSCCCSSRTRETSAWQTASPETAQHVCRFRSAVRTARMQHHGGSSLLVVLGSSGMARRLASTLRGAANSSSWLADLCVPAQLLQSQHAARSCSTSSNMADARGLGGLEGSDVVVPLAPQPARPARSATSCVSAVSRLWHPGQQRHRELLLGAQCTRGFASSSTAAQQQQQQQQQQPELIIHPSAVQRLKELQAQQPPGRTVALRIEVEGGGCSGYQYKFSLESLPTQQAGGPSGDAAPEDAPPPDRVFEVEGVRVVCDPDSLEMLRGSRVEFEDTLMRRAFVVGANPNSEASCGCGSSFAAKMPPITRPKLATA